MKISYINNEFEIVNSIPKNYVVWNIGKNMIEGYLPLCELYKGTYKVNPNTLKAIKIENAQEILKIASFIKDITPQGLLKYYNKNKNSKSTYTRQKANKVLVAYNILKEVPYD